MGNYGRDGNENCNFEIISEKKREGMNLEKITKIARDSCKLRESCNFW